jgi:hypothetical protein
MELELAKIIGLRPETTAHNPAQRKINISLLHKHYVIEPSLVTSEVHV